LVVLELQALAAQEQHQAWLQSVQQVLARPAQYLA
jgi:hypothetical protein